MNNLKIICLVAFLLLFSGCARFVTDKNIIDNQVITPIKYMDLLITFAQALPSDAQCYIVLGTTTNVFVVNKTQPQGTYFVTPVDVITNWAPVRTAYSLATDDITPLYDDYFKTWDQLYVYDAAYSWRQYVGPFIVTANQGIKPDPIDRRSYIITAPTNQLHLKIPIPADTFQFQFLVVDGAKKIRDNLSTMIPVTFVNNNNPSAIAQDPDNGDGYDIINYKIGTYQN